MFAPTHADTALAGPGTAGATGLRLAEILSGRGPEMREPGRSDLDFETELKIRPLDERQEPPDLWAVDGGQALVADARCIQVYAARASRVRWQHGRCTTEDEGALRVCLFGMGEERQALAGSGAPVSPEAPVDVNLLRDWLEWESVATCAQEALPGGLVLVDGDLQPDWRISSSWLEQLLSRAATREVVVAGVTKHTSLTWGGAPLLGRLERLAGDTLGPRARWWVPVARTRPDVGAGIQVVVARLDPDARFSFRVDLPGALDGPGVERVLGMLCAMSDDAAFPGYPYPLSVADRLAACPPHIRDDVWASIEDVLDAAGVPWDVRERAFADRHRLMERA
jgi:hypothetical protein